LRVRRNPDQECCDLIGTRRFIRGASRGCKVRSSQGDIIDLAVDAEAGRLAEANTDQPRKQVSGRLETNRIGERCQTQDLGQPGNWSSSAVKAKQPEQSGGVAEANRMVSDPKRFGHPISRCRKMSIQGNLDTDRRRYRGREAAGQPAAFTTGTAERERIGATRRSITGQAGDAGQGATQVLHRGRCARKQEPPGETRTLAETSSAEGMRSLGQPEPTIAGTAEV